MADTDIILEGRDITKMYGGVEALNKVTFKLPRNEVVALLGDNGAGKSTLIKILSGAIPPSSGQVLIDGNPVEMSSTKHAKELGIETVYQDLALVDCLSIEKNIYLGKEIVRKYLGLEVLQNRAMKKGALQFLKEVGINIDDPDRILNMILELKKKGLSIIFITHNMEHAFLVADRFFVLRVGVKVGERKRGETNPEEIVRMITGAICVDAGQVTSNNCE